MAESVHTLSGGVDPDIFCCQLSRRLQEPLLATAVHNTYWFLLEYDRPWAARATEENDLPRAVQEWLDAQLEATAGRGRVQFIKKPPGEQPADHLTFFVAHARQQQPRLYRFQLQRYEDLLSLDLSGLLAGEAGFEGLRHSESLFLVCTNGRRDRCCALRGLEIVEALKAVAGDAVWQTTHVGGHRFAPNILTFPDGTYYGRLEAQEAPAFVARQLQGEIDVEHLRGRACYTKPVQAADTFLRRETGIRALDALPHVATVNPQANQYEAQFEAQDGTRYTVQLRRTPSDLPVYASCGKPQTKPLWEYHLLSIGQD